MSFVGNKKIAVLNALELKLRRCKGTGLQEFLAAIMTKIHGANFIPTGTDYSRGDLQCDGMLQNPITIFACYGPVNAGANATEAAMKTAVDKVSSDFKGALKEWPTLSEWVFVTNYIVMPAQIIQTITVLRAANPTKTLSLFGKERFEETILNMSVEAVDDLIGNAVTDEDFRSMQPAEVFQVVHDIMQQVQGNDAPDDEPTIIPEKKLLFNGLAPIYQKRIHNGFQNARRVADLLQNHANPLFDSEVAGAFKAKYLALKVQGFAPGDIMDELYEFALAGHKAKTVREVAIWSLLAHLFEKCTIFEGAPVEEVA